MPVREFIAIGVNNINIYCNKYFYKNNEVEFRKIIIPIFNKLFEIKFNNLFIYNNYIYDVLKLYSVHYHIHNYIIIIIDDAFNICNIKENEFFFLKKYFNSLLNNNKYTKYNIYECDLHKTYKDFNSVIIKNMIK